MSQDLTALAAEAYVYGFPLVFDVEQVLRLQREGLGSLKPAPFNEFSHATQLAGPQDTFVSVNNDTVYSMAQLDLSGGPLSLHVPDTAGAYYVLQFVDAWTNNFAYAGRRATGTAEATYLLAPPGWAGTPPHGVTVIPVPTTVATIVGRFACDGPDDMPRVRALQDQLTLTAAGPGSGVPEPEDPSFFAKLRIWMAAFPPSAEDQEYQRRFAPLWLPDARPALADGLTAGKQRIEELSHQGTGAKVNGWGVGLHLFDYNNDFLELGTVDSPEWRIADRPTAYPTRAMAARVGLWGNHAYEAVYAAVYTDEADEQLTGARSYTLRFAEPPPVDAFWSLTMYDMPDYFLVDNPIDRYSIGDRTPGLRRAADGSLTILMQHLRPTDDANWLSAPPGDFRPMMRFYQPRQSILDGGYHLPPVRRES